MVACRGRVSIISNGQRLAFCPRSYLSTRVTRPTRACSPTACGARDQRHFDSFRDAPRRRTRLSSIHFCPFAIFWHTEVTVPNMPLEPPQQQISGSVSHVLSVSHAAPSVLELLSLCRAWLLSFESLLEMISLIVGCTRLPQLTPDGEPQNPETPIRMAV
jgi:hypothetical protein